MKTYWVQERIGEFTGNIDWDYDFKQHLTNGSKPEERLAKQIAILRMIEAETDKYQATDYGGWPRCGWSDILQVGMYDGWPYWKPVPSVMLRSPVTRTGWWHSFCSIVDIRIKGDEWPLKIDAEAQTEASQEPSSGHPDTL